MNFYHKMSFKSFTLTMVYVKNALVLTKYFVYTILEQILKTK